MIGLVEHKFIELEEKILLNVLKTYLNREPIQDDFRHVKRFFSYNDNSRYLLTYDNFELGYVYYKLNEYTINIEFIHL